MTLDEAHVFLESKGHFLSSFSRLTSKPPHLGWMASSRPIKGGKVQDGETGWGRTPQRALDALIRQHGGDPAPADPWLALESALDDLTEAFGG